MGAGLTVVVQPLGESSADYVSGHEAGPLVNRRRHKSAAFG
jgi:hypothetical protein